MRLALGHPRTIPLAKLASRFHLQPAHTRQPVFPDACATKVMKETSATEKMFAVVAKLVGSSTDLEMIQCGANCVQQVPTRTGHGQLVLAYASRGMSFARRDLGGRTATFAPQAVTKSGSDPSSARVARPTPTRM